MPRSVACRRRVEAVIAVALAAACTVAVAGCAQPLLPSAPIAHQVVVELDVSASTLPTLTGWTDQAAAVLDQQPDGTEVFVAVADGADRATPCPTRTVVLRGDGDRVSTATADLQADRADARQAVAEQLDCGRANPTPGSDLLGSLLIVSGQLEPGLDTTHIVLFSDGMQTSDDLALTPAILTRPAALERAIATLDDRDLISTRMADSRLSVSGPGPGSRLSDAERRGLTTFWTAYANKAHATLTRLG